MTSPNKLGVVIVTFNSADVILDCLESLFGSDDKDALSVVVVDNASSDNTCAVISDWAGGARDAARSDWPVGMAVLAAKPVVFQVQQMGEATAGEAPLTLVRSDINGGYAYGVNAGLNLLRQRENLAGYWILNPDCVVPPQTPARLLERLRAGGIGMLSSRCLHLEAPDTVQTDGGRVRRWTGVCDSIHSGCNASTTPLPDAATLDFVTGANIVVSRAFVDQVGLMPEDYFLYYEEVEWALRRGNWPIELLPGAEVYHRGGTSIGSGNGIRQASPFSDYFNQRNRVRFVKRNFPAHAPVSIGWSFAKAVQALLRAGAPQALAILAGALDLRPPRSVSARISDPAARRLAFGRHANKG
jgi:GT2 family glycosyltransferase